MVRRTPDTRTELDMLLEDLSTFHRRFVVFRDLRHAYAVALWIVHTYAMAAFESTMYLALMSPEKGSGKTRALEVLELLVRAPWRITTPSEAVLFSNIAQRHPTLLLDEVDAVFSKNRETEGLRAILNVGNRRGGMVPRLAMHGTKRKIVDFEVFGAKAFAGIGTLPETMADRSIPIPMQRRLQTEPVERLIIRDVRPDAEALRERCEQAVEPLLEQLADYRINGDAPEKLSDRQQEGWEPLYALAVAADGPWLERAQDISVLLHDDSGAQASDDLLLLEHIRDAFEAKKTDRLATPDLLAILRQRDEGPWARWFDMAFDDADLKSASSLARHLRRYDIRSKKFRDGRQTSNGYERMQFDPVWERYL
jgi:hypothetical protein